MIRLSTCPPAGKLDDRPTYTTSRDIILYVENGGSPQYLNKVIDYFRGRDIRSIVPL
ncbi:hypothetical protein [Rhizobium ruizarguesonis]|uniref:hypothetical protein n=1 Tax=Rhizobium ruizarguesonis TaxID=2081791 RepID=UPI0013EECE41|nr:hypothetical protein [Rhizobium ruizarguesonis]